MEGEGTAMVRSSLPWPSTTMILPGASRERGLCPIELASLTLCNGSVHLELAQLTLVQKALRDRTVGPIFARLANRRVFGAQMRRIFGKPDAVAEEELDAMWELLERAGGCLRAPQLSTYQDDRVRFRERWIGSLERLDLPGHASESIGQRGQRGLAEDRQRGRGRLELADRGDDLAERRVDLADRGDRLVDRRRRVVGERCRLHRCSAVAKCADVRVIASDPNAMQRGGTTSAALAWNATGIPSGFARPAAG